MVSRSPRIIDGRLPIDVNYEPVAIDTEDKPALDELKKKADSLNELRQEIGRLYQIIDNVKNLAHKEEKELASDRRDLLKKYNLTDGKWVIDFDAAELLRLDEDAPLVS